jgi:catechol 2,3-dioxygenase-like lactoylglutathione lyase family enzyme
MTDITSFDHIALAVPNLNDQVERLTTLMGMVLVQRQADAYALVADPVSGFKIELSQSADDEAHFRHLGFTTPNVDTDHDALVEAGMASTEAPHRREFAKMRTAFLKEQSGLEVQLVDYDKA